MGVVYMGVVMLCGCGFLIDGQVKSTFVVNVINDGGP